MNFFTLCLLFALLVIYANAQMTGEFNPDEELAPIRVKRQWGYGWGWRRPYWGRPYGMYGGGMYGGGWGYPYGGGFWG